jgi:hypothetical protein
MGISIDGAKISPTKRSGLGMRREEILEATAHKESAHPFHPYFSVPLLSAPQLMPGDIWGPVYSQLV